MIHYLVGFPKERYILRVALLLLADLLVPLLPGLDAKEFPFFTVQAAAHTHTHRASDTVRREARLPRIPEEYGRAGVI